MLEVIGVQSAEELIQKTIPKSIINDKILNDLDKKFPFKTREFDGESDVLNELLVNYADKNNYKMKSFIGQGYYGVCNPFHILTFFMCLAQRFSFLHYNCRLNFHQSFSETFWRIQTGTHHTLHTKFVVTNFFTHESKY